MQADANAKVISRRLAGAFSGGRDEPRNPCGLASGGVLGLLDGLTVSLSRRGAGDGSVLPFAAEGIGCRMQRICFTAGAFDGAWEFWRESGSPRC